MSRIIDDGAGGNRNAAEIKARQDALHSSIANSVYNPATDPEKLSQAAVEASRGAASLPSMRVYGRGGKVEADLRLRGGDSAGEDNEDVTPLPGAIQYVERDALSRVTAPKPPSTHPIWTEQSWEAESKEAVMALVPQGSKGIEVKRVWKASALVKQ